MQTMPRAARDPNEKAEALRLLAEVGIGEASRRTGIPKGTIASWGHRSGVQSPDPSVTAHVVERRLMSLAERKARLAEGLMDDIERMRLDLFSGTLERKVVGGTQFRDTEIIDVHHRTTTPTERKVTIEAIAKGIETVQLLTGEATQRIEASGGAEPAQRARLVSVVTQLADRRAS